jgi:hypothetical protein
MYQHIINHYSGNTSFSFDNRQLSLSDYNTMHTSRDMKVNHFNTILIVCLGVLLVLFVILIALCKLHRKGYRSEDSHRLLFPKLGESEHFRVENEHS